MDAATVPRRYPRDERGGRLRGHRTPTGEFLELDEQLDIEIFKVLAQIRYVRARLLYELLPASVRPPKYNRFQDRLTKLFHETNTAYGGAYIEWPRLPEDQKGLRTGIYRLGNAGKKALIASGYNGPFVHDLVLGGKQQANRNFPHAMKICDTIALIRIGVAKHPGITFTSCVELLEQLPEKGKKLTNPLLLQIAGISHTYPKTGKTEKLGAHHLLPDDLFRLTYTLPDGSIIYRDISLEAENRNPPWRSNLIQRSWLKKVLGYREIVRAETYRSQLGLKNLLVLGVSSSPLKVKHMSETIMEVVVAKDKERAAKERNAQKDPATLGSNLFLLQLLPEIRTTFSKNEAYERVLDPIPEFFSLPFKRAGRPDFYLDRIEVTKKEEAAA